MYEKSVIEREIPTSKSSSHAVTMRFAPLLVIATESAFAVPVTVSFPETTESDASGAFESF